MHIRLPHALALSGLLAFFACPALAQDDPWNLSFDQYNAQYKSFTPWYKTFYYKKQHRIAPDSTTRREGRYSVRIQYAPDAPDKSDGQFVNNVPLDVPCKKLRISFYAKIEGQTPGGVSILLAQDKAEKKHQVESVNIKDTSWTLYTREFDLDSFSFPLDHVRLTVGYAGEQSLWLDHFVLEADGRNVYELTPACYTPGEVVAPLSDRQTDHLVLLGQLWGFLKYYHPQVGKGTFNWDQQLFAMIPPVKKAANAEALSQLFLDWIESLGEVPSCKSCGIGPQDSLLTQQLDESWISSPQFTPALQAKLAHIRANRFQGNHHYVQYDAAQNPRFSNEYEYRWRKSKYPNEHFRLLALYRYWNIIHYFFPYKELIGTNWNQVLRNYLPRIAAAKDSMAYNLALLQLVTSVNDSHASSYNPVVATQYNLYLPVILHPASQHITVTGFRQDSLAALEGWQQGDVIEKVGNRSIQELIRERGALAGGSNEPARLRILCAQNYLTGGTDSTVTLTIRRNHKSFTKTFRRYPFSQFTPWAEPKGPAWKILDNNIGYVNMAILERIQVDSMMQALRNTHTIIFDIRNYPKGTMWSIIEYLHTKPVHFANLTYPYLAYPGTFKWTRPIALGGPMSAGRKDKVFHYTGKILALVNEDTQSQAEWTAMAFQTVPGCVTLGSQTSGADGNASQVYLPGGYFTYMTGLGVFYPDGSPTQRVGVKVDITVLPTPQGIAAGRDEVLEAALAHIKQP